MTLLRFVDRPRLLAFASFLDQGQENGLAGLELIVAKGGGDDGLRVPDARLNGLDKATLGHWGASLATDQDQPGVLLAELHARVDLVPATSRVLPSQLLVLPWSARGPFDGRRMADLVADLAERRDWRAGMWPAAFTDDRLPVTLLRLDAQTRVLSDHGVALAGRPFVLAGDADGRTFVPLGYRHPLAAHEFLFPPLPEGVLRIWCPSIDGDQVRWRMRFLRPLTPEPTALVFGVELSAARALGGAAFTPIAADQIRVPLQVGPDTSDRETRQLRRVRRLHRFTSTDGVLGPRLLQLLDQAEAGARDLLYYHGRRTSEATATAEHFVVERRLVEEGEEFTPPGEQVYLQPEGFVRAGLPMFVLRGSWFRPAIDRMLVGLDDDHGLLGDLRARFGLQSDASAIALVEPGPSPDAPTVLVLTGGQPLGHAVRFVLDHFHGDRVVQVGAAAEASVDDDLEAGHEATRAAIAEECEAVDDEVDLALDALRTVGTEIEADLAKAEARVAALAAFLAAGDAQFKRGAVTWNEVADTVFALEARLADKHADWLAAFAAAEENLALALQARQLRGIVLQQWCEERLVGLREKEREIAACHAEVERIAGELAAGATRADESHRKLLAALADARTRYTAWEQRQVTAKQDLDRAAAETRTRSSELAARQQRLRAERAKVDADLADVDRRLRQFETEAAELRRDNERLEAENKELAARQRAVNDQHDQQRRLADERARLGGQPFVPGAKRKRGKTGM